MGNDRYESGKKCSQGFIINEILGQSSKACVYTTSDMQLRWEYRENNGVLPEDMGALILHFDMLMHRIRATVQDDENKPALYILLGKTLFSGLNGHSKTRPSVLFSFVDQQIKKYQADTAIAPDRYDLAIICALTDLELDSVLNLGNWEKLAAEPADPQSYYGAQWRTQKGSDIGVIAAAPNHMGTTCAGVLAAKLIWKYRPKVVAMTGIAAGARAGSQGFGDIVCPDHTYDYGASKIIEANGTEKILPSANPLSTNSRALGILKEWRRNRTKLADIKAEWPANTPATSINVHIGPVFSSPFVLDSEKSVASLVAHSRKLAGIEMEAHAVHRACHDTVEPEPAFICLKSICDFAQAKNDDWQHYSAYTSARFLFELISAEWERLVP